MQSTQSSIDDGSLWPDGCPQCIDGTRTLPYRWADGTAKYICRAEHSWQTAWADLPPNLTGFNLANVRRSA